MRARTAAIALAFGLAAGAGPALAQPFDHLACYKVKDAKTFSSAMASIEALQGQFSALGCQVKPKAKQVCVPVSAQVGTIEGGTHSEFPAENLAFDRFCYRVKCSGAVPSTLEMGDAFGTRTLEKFKISTICTPGVVGAAPTTTTTTLPPLPSCSGGGGFPACSGDCSQIGPTRFCDPRNGQGTCACVLPCTDLNPGSGDICATGGCPVDSRCAPIDSQHCGCIFDPGS